MNGNISELKLIKVREDKCLGLVERGGTELKEGITDL